jgi:4'-phosphopantetheinyl transferase
MDLPISWQPSPENLILGSDEVHVWRAMLNLSLSHVQVLEQTLTSDERVRAGQFHFQKDKHHFIVARGLLRTILGRYLARDPQQLRFCYNPYGKPTLAQESAGDTLFFNVTHSHGMALYALAHSGEIGIDLEFIHKEGEFQQIAERFFSPYEVAMLRAVPAYMQREAFFRCWCRKEAYLKARSRGLSLALNQFDVTVAPGKPAALLSTREENQDISRWSLYDLFPGSDFIAALAIDGHPSRLQCWQWNELEIP